MTDETAFPPPDEVGEILVSEAEITSRVAELGRRIAGDYSGEVPLLVGVLKGSLVFVADLMRAIPGPVEIDFLAVSSYGAATESSGVVRILKDLDHDITDRHVIVVEDIVDSGLTLSFLRDHLAAQRPASVRVCSLLVRETAEATAAEVDYVGFHLPPAFVIGYGLDVDQRYRNLPYIATYAGIP
jgi:hypoxanthine phosphoribosyltransferase